MGTLGSINGDPKSVYLTNWPKQGNSLKKKKLFCWQKYWSIWIFLITELTFTDKLPWDPFKLVCVITSNQIVHIRWWLHAFKPKIENGDLMGANGGPKTEEGPHGDLGLQMGTHVGAVHLSYSLGLLGLKMIYFIPENHNKKTLEHRTLLVYHNLYCFVAIYAVLIQYILFYCNRCCFIAIHAVLLPFC